MSYDKQLKETIAHLYGHAPAFRERMDAANLTPDEESGLGMWTEEMFVGAIRQGKKYGNGRPLMPPMPWPAYSHLTDRDVRAVFAYLKTVKPIVNHVPEWHQSTN